MRHNFCFAIERSSLLGRSVCSFGNYTLLLLFFFLVLIYNAGLQLRGLHLEIFYIDGYSIDIQTDESYRRMRNSESEFLKRAG